MSHNISHRTLRGRNAALLPGSSQVEDILGVIEKAGLSHGELWKLEKKNFQINFVPLKYNCLHVVEKQNLFCADSLLQKACVSLN